MPGSNEKYWKFELLFYIKYHHIDQVSGPNIWANGKAMKVGGFASMDAACDDRSL